MLAETIAKVTEDTDDGIYALSFCLALRLMSIQHADDLTLNTRLLYQPPDRVSLMNTLRDPPFGNHHNGLKPHRLTIMGPDPIFNYLVERSHRSRAAIGVGFLFASLHGTYYSGRHLKGWGGFFQGPSPGSPPLALPTYDNAKLHSLVDFPLPLVPLDDRDLATSHLTRMCTSDYMESGEWTGIYTYSIAGMEVKFDPPMEHVRFKTTAPDRSDWVLDFQATGRDSVGEFELDGSMNPDTGLIQMQKGYTQRLQWQWDCLMTPFGIVGWWGRPDRPYRRDCWAGQANPDVGGWVWLWKS